MRTPVRLVLGSPVHVADGCQRVPNDEGLQIGGHLRTGKYLRCDAPGSRKFTLEELEQSDSGQNGTYVLTFTRDLAELQRSLKG